MDIKSNIGLERADVYRNWFRWKRCHHQSSPTHNVSLLLLLSRVVENYDTIKGTLNYLILLNLKLPS